MWKAKYKPRYVAQRPRRPMIADSLSSNHVPWIVIGVCVVMCAILLFSIRVLLDRENKRRDAEPRDDSYDDVHVVKIDENGKRVEVKVSKVRVRSYWEVQINHVILRAGVLGFDRSRKSRLQICPVISTCRRFVVFVKMFVFKLYSSHPVMSVSRIFWSRPG